VSIHEILPPYRSSNSSDQDSSWGSTLSARYSGAMKPQSSTMKYCWPLIVPCFSNWGFSCDQFFSKDVSHGCTAAMST
jgi:hypothetical protein